MAWGKKHPTTTTQCINQWREGGLFWSLSDINHGFKHVFTHSLWRTCICLSAFVWNSSRDSGSNHPWGMELAILPPLARSLRKLDFVCAAESDAAEITTSRHGQTSCCVERAIERQKPVSRIWFTLSMTLHLWCKCGLTGRGIHCSQQSSPSNFTCTFWRLALAELVISFTSLARLLLWTSRDPGIIQLY